MNQTSVWSLTVPVFPATGTPSELAAVALPQRQNFAPLPLAVRDQSSTDFQSELAHCESGSWGPSDRPIHGSRSVYLGRLQFSIGTVIAYQRRRDGTQLSRQEAIDAAHDYDRAASLAKYMIFDLEGPHHWPLCARKIGLRSQMAAIKTLSNQALAW
jgi:hypothetical protein